MSMRTMFDALTARNILNHNRTPALVAGYIDRIKLAPWTASDWALFPNARKVTIVKKASTRDGHVLDVEPGDATPEEAPGWAAQRRRDGFAYPVIYCNRSTWPKVKAAFAAQNVAPPLYWIATASGQPVIPDGAIAAQYLLDYQGVDVSVVADYWPGVDGPEKENEMWTEADFNTPLFTDNAGTAQARTVRFRDVMGELRDRSAATAKALSDLAVAVAKGNGITADQLAAKMLPALTTALLAEVQKVDAISDEDALQIAQAVTDRAAALFKPAA
jgi:hypothetical protein